MVGMGSPAFAALRRGRPEPPKAIEVNRPYLSLDEV
jgi:hypothetical protein